MSTNTATQLTTYARMALARIAAAEASGDAATVSRETEGLRRHAAQLEARGAMAHAMAVLQALEAS